MNASNICIRCPRSAPVQSADLLTKSHKSICTSATCMLLTNKRRLLRSGQFAGWLSSEVAPYPIRQESEDRTSLSKA